MHEMSYMIKFINMAEEAASDEPEATIKKLSVRIGEMTGVLPEFLYRYFPDASAGTRCEGADFEVDFVPVEVKCKGCGRSYHPQRDNGYCCPACGSKDATYLRGRELELVSIEM